MWFCPSYHLAGASPLDVGYPFLVGSNILLSMVVQQWVVILEFSQEKMSACPSILPLMSSHHSQQKSLKCTIWMQSQKWQNDLYSFPMQTIQHHSNPSLCSDQKCWRSWSWTVLWRPTRPSRTNTQKRYPFHYKGLECHSRKSRDTWSKANLALEYKTKHVKDYQSFSKRMQGSQQTPSSNNTREDSTHGHHQMVNDEIRLILVFAAKDGEALYS